MCYKDNNSNDSGYTSITSHSKNKQRIHRQIHKHTYSPTLHIRKQNIKLKNELKEAKLSLKSYKTQNNILQEQIKSKNKVIEDYQKEPILKQNEFVQNILDIFGKNLNKDRELTIRYSWKN